VPAVMVLAGKWNWWLPEWLKDRLPNVHLEH
jgi:putative drug exporter of the RND superfamily